MTGFGAKSVYHTALKVSPLQSLALTIYCSCPSRFRRLGRSGLRVCILPEGEKKRSYGQVLKAE